MIFEKQGGKDLSHGIAHFFGLCLKGFFTQKSPFVVESVKEILKEKTGDTVRKPQKKSFSHFFVRKLISLVKNIFAAQEKLFLTSSRKKYAEKSENQAWIIFTKKQAIPWESSLFGEK